MKNLALSNIEKAFNLTNKEQTVQQDTGDDNGYLIIIIKLLRRRFCRFQTKSETLLERRTLNGKKRKKKEQERDMPL